MTPPSGSIYLWMYRQGLQGRPLDEVVTDCMLGGRDIRPKDLRNYWNGWYKRRLRGADPMAALGVDPCAPMGPLNYSDYPDHPFLGKPEFTACFVPCNGDNRPMVKWSLGTMSLADAMAWPGCRYIAENMLGAQRIVIDVDGDHGGDLDLETVRFFDRFRYRTCCHEKPDIVFDWYVENQGECCVDLHTAELPTSYHLTFGVTKVIPTMHFPRAHVDVIGNKRNSLRYFKNKKYNGLPPLMMSEEIWDEIFDWIERRSL